AHAAFRRHDKTIALALQPLADDVLAATGGLGRRRHRINIGRVDEIAAALGSLVHNREGSLLVTLAGEGHRTEADFRDFQARVAHAAAFHRRYPLSRMQIAVSDCRLKHAIPWLSNPNPASVVILARSRQRTHPAHRYSILEKSGGLRHICEYVGRPSLLGRRK